MKQEEKAYFVEIMSGVAELYSKKLSPSLLEVYWQALMNYSYAEVNKALNAHVLNPDNGQFMPKPADIVRFIDGATQTTAMRAWSKVKAAIKAVGIYQSIVFDDPIIHIVITEMEGWISLGQVKEEKLSFVAFEFQKRYASYLVHKPTVYPAKLSGIFEQQNGFNGHAAPSIILYGNETQARYVYETGIREATANNIHVLKPHDSSSEEKLKNVVKEKKEKIPLDWRN